eukprot:6482247-Amphidinium_carterae.1
MLAHHLTPQSTCLADENADAVVNSMSLITHALGGVHTKFLAVIACGLNLKKLNLTVDKTIHMDTMKVAKGVIKKLTQALAKVDDLICADWLTPFKTMASTCGEIVEKELNAQMKKEGERMKELGEKLQEMACQAEPWKQDGVSTFDAILEQAKQTVLMQSPKALTRLADELEQVHCTITPDHICWLDSTKWHCLVSVIPCQVLLVYTEMLEVSGQFAESHVAQPKGLLQHAHTVVAIGLFLNSYSSEDTKASLREQAVKLVKALRSIHSDKAKPEKDVLGAVLNKKVQALLTCK